MQHACCLQAPDAIRQPLPARQPHGMLAAFQASLVLRCLVQQVGTALRAAGRPAVDTPAAYAAALQRLLRQEADVPRLHCMALPGAAVGGLPAVAQQAYAAREVLAIEFCLHE